MLRTFQRWMAASLLTGILCLPVGAQAPENEPDKDRRPPVPEFTVAFLVTALVLVVVCMPTRKS